MNSLGCIFAIKRLEIHDGPGVRTTLFLKGCPLRCLWCHNPESLSGKPQLAFYSHKCTACGACVKTCPRGARTVSDGVHTIDREKCIACGACESVCPSNANKIFGQFVRAEDVMPELLLDKPFYDETGGGVTFSGGEPLLQPDFLFELLSLAKREGIHTAVDTALDVPIENLKRVADLVDLFLCDVKAYDSDVHKRLTGRGNERIISNLCYLRDIGKPIEVRVPFIPGYNDGEIDSIGTFIAEFPNVVKVKALAYHDLARTKYEALGVDYPLVSTKCPGKEELTAVQMRLDGALTAVSNNGCFK